MSEMLMILLLGLSALLDTSAVTECLDSTLWAMFESGRLSTLTADRCCPHARKTSTIADKLTLPGCHRPSKEAHRRGRCSQRCGRRAGVSSTGVLPTPPTGREEHGPRPACPSFLRWGSLEHGRVEQLQQRQQDTHPSLPIIADSAGGNVTRGPSPPAEQSSLPPQPPYAHDGEHQRDALPPPSPNRHDGGMHQRDAWPPAASQELVLIAAETKFSEYGTPIQSLFPAPPMGALSKPSPEGASKRSRDNNESGGDTSTADADRGGGDAAEDSGGCAAVAEQSSLPLTTTNSTADVSTGERTAEVAGFGFSAEECADGAPSVAAPAPTAGPAGGGRRTSSGVGYGQAVLAAAEELADHCQIPGVSAAATAVSILIHLVLNSRDLTSRGEAVPVDRDDARAGGIGARQGWRHEHGGGVRFDGRSARRRFRSRGADPNVPDQEQARPVVDIDPV